MGLFSSLEREVAKTFKDVRSRQILEYAMVFLGSSPTNSPSLYSLLSHVDLNLGVWFPEGGMNGVAQSRSTTTLPVSRIEARKSPELSTLKVNTSKPISW